MLPNGLGALLLLLVLVPGWVYIVQKEQYIPSPSRNGLGEILQVTAAGLAFTGLSVCAYTFASSGLEQIGFFSVEEWAQSGSNYLTANPKKGVISLALIIAVAVGLAMLASQLQRRHLPPRYSASPTWEQTLGTGPKGHIAWIGIETMDDRLIEGVLHSFELDSPYEGPRDIAIKSPIYVTENHNKVSSNVERVIISSDQIRHITVQFIDPKT